MFIEKQQINYSNRNKSILTERKEPVKMMTNMGAIPKAAQTREAGAFTKRIGSTVYRVSVYFSDTSAETARDKILRLVKNEAVAGRGQ